MNKKGFTLAEILGVIVIISLLLLLTMPTIINKIAQNGNQASDINDSLIYDAVDDYIKENIDTDKSGTYCIPIKDLIDAGKLVEPVIDVETGEDISDKTISVTIDNQGNITHKIVEPDECSADSTVYKIDFIVNPNNTKWLHERSVIIKYPNMGSGYNYQYKIDNGNWQSAQAGNYELPVFTKISTLQARVVGATTITNSIDITHIDNENPTINSISIEPNSKISIKAIDNVSGIAGYYISETNTKPNADAEGWTKVDVDAGQEENIVVSKGQGTYYIWVKDKAGNISTASGNNNSITLENKTVTATFTKGNNVDSIDSNSKSCTILAGNTSCQITLPRITASEGYIPRGWYNGNNKVGNVNDSYSISNNITLTAQAIVDTVTLSISTTRTTNSITVVANATATSGIAKYEYSKDGGKTWINGGTSNTYKFTGLTQGTNYNVMVRVTAESGKTETARKNVTTATISHPTFKESGTTTKTVTITFPDGCGSTYTCTYQKNNGSVVTVTNKTANVTFTDDGEIVATVSDGTNKVSSSYTVSMVINATYHSGYYYCPSGYTSSGSGSNMTCRKTTTIDAYYRSSYYSCPSGYPNRSGTTCYTNWTRVTGTVICNDHNLSHTDNQSSYDECDDSRYSENGDHCASDGSYTYHPTAYCRNSTSATYHSSYYYCPSGYTEIGSGSSMTCRKTTTIDAYYSAPYYTCPLGYTLSGSLCYPN